MRRVSPLILLLAAPLAFGADVSLSGTRMTPPTIREVSPLGIQRGATVEVSIVGYNLAHASAIYFSEPSIKATITRIKELPDQDDVRLGGNGTPLTVDLGPLPVRNEVTAELDVAADAPIGPVNFRVLTPLGLSPQGTLSLEPFYGESPDREPNDTPEQVTELTGLPAILTGAISKPGDVDYFKIHARAGQRIRRKPERDPRMDGRWSASREQFRADLREGRDLLCPDFGLQGIREFGAFLPDHGGAASGGDQRVSLGRGRGQDGGSHAGRI